MGVVLGGVVAELLEFVCVIESYGRAPRQAVVDGGYASRENLQAAKALGVEDVAFPKKCGLTIEEMVKSAWVY